MNTQTESSISRNEGGHLRAPGLLLAALTVLGCIIWALICGGFHRLRTWLVWKRACGWCGKWLGGIGLSGKTTHGICRACKANWQAELKQAIKH